MYCSACGVAVAQGLSYCKNCGARLNQDDRGKSSEVRPDLLVTSMVATFVFGLGIIAVLMGVMKAILDVDVNRILAFMFFPFLLMVLLEGVFMWLLLRRKKGAEETIALPQSQATNELDAAQARALPEGGMGSVIEHTTRTFEPVYRREQDSD